MIDLFERGTMHPPLDLCVGARAVYDAIAAPNACELVECSLELHLISVRDRMTHGLVRKLYWVDARDLLVDGPTNGGIDRFLLRRVSDDCLYEATKLAISRCNAGSVTNSLATQEAVEDLDDLEP